MGRYIRAKKSSKWQKVSSRTSRELPGTIKVFKAPKQWGPSYLFAQWDFGTNACRVEPYKHSNTKESMELQFKQCLSELGKHLILILPLAFCLGQDVTRRGGFKSLLILIKGFSNTQSRTVYVVVNPPSRPILNLKDSFDNNLPIPKRKPNKGSSNTNQEKALFVSDSGDYSQLSDFSCSKSSSNSRNSNTTNSVICID